MVINARGKLSAGVIGNILAARLQERGIAAVISGGSVRDGVAVLPGHVLVGDSDGVVVVPQAMAEEVANDGAEQERLEGFLKSRVEASHPTIGTYPPNAATLQAYEDWKAANLDG